MQKKNKNRIQQVRDLLRASPDGMTVQGMIEAIEGISKPHLSRILNTMPDAYIDRWEAAKEERWQRAVWCVVIPPEDCPRPCLEIIRRKNNGR